MGPLKWKKFISEKRTKSAINKSSYYENFKSFAQKLWFWRTNCHLFLGHPVHTPLYHISKWLFWFFKKVNLRTTSLEKLPCQVEFPAYLFDCYVFLFRFLLKILKTFTNWIYSVNKAIEKICRNFTWLVSFSRLLALRVTISKNKNTFLDMVHGSVCTKFQVCIFFRCGQKPQYRHTNRHTYWQVKIGMSSPGCSPHVDFDTEAWINTVNL